MNKFKYFLSTFLILLFVCLKANGQIGIKCGISVTDIIMDPEVQSQYLGYEINILDRAKPLLGYQIGILGNIKIIRQLDFQPELLFISQGTQLKSDYIYDDVAYKISIRYLQMPLLFSYWFLSDKTWHPRVYAGPYVSLKLNAKKSLEINGDKEVSDFSQVKAYDLGLIFGFAFDIDLSKGQILLDMRLGYGLMNSIEKLDNYIRRYGKPETELARNLDITFSAGYRWGSLFK